MNFKVTVIGSTPESGAAADTSRDAKPSAGFKPTVFPGAPASIAAVAPAPALKEPYRPTAMRPATPERTSDSATGPARSLAPTTMKPSAPPPQPLAPAPMKLSVMPGVQRKGMDVSLEELVRRFPGVDQEVLQAAQGVLAGVYLADMTAVGWVGFGMPVQDELSGLVKKRLELAQTSDVRAAGAHLARLHQLLSEVLEAFNGGLFKRSPERVWSDCKVEVAHVEQLLRTAGSTLIAQMQVLEAQKAPAQECKKRLDATAQAAEFLTDKVPAEAGGVLVGRVGSLTASQATLQDHLAFIEADMTQQRELALLVQDGVLVKLPALYTNLAGLAGKPTETERFLASEKLTDLLHTLNKGKA